MDQRFFAHLDRRQWLLGSALLLTSCAANSTRAVVGSSAKPTTFVLVHGAWHGGWCWREVGALLKSAGHRVFATTLTGLGNRKSELSADIGLATHIADVAEVFEANDLQDVVLVGHSYGGMPITGAVDGLRDRVSHLVYLDAAVPDDGETMITQGRPLPAQVLQMVETQLRSAAADGIALPAGTPEGLGIPATHPLHDWVADNLTPHPLKTWFDPVSLTNGGREGISSTYIHCNAPALPNTSFGWHAERLTGVPEWDVRYLATGHDAMITAPAELAEILLKVAGKRAGAG